MKADRTRAMQDRADIFKAMGHPARLAMLIGLGRKARCVCELREMVGLDLSTVSKHLTVLRYAGLVDAERRGKRVFYSLRCPCTLDFLDCVERAIAERAR